MARWVVRVAASTAAVFGAATGEAASGQEDGASLTPFVWLPAISGRMSFGPFSIPVDFSPADIAGGIKSGVMLYGEGEDHGMRIFGQLIAADFTQSGFKPLLGLDVDVKLLSVEAGVGKPLRWQRLTVTPLAAVRYNYLSGGFGGEVGALHARRRWTELLLGSGAQYRASERLDLHLRYTQALAGPPGKRNRDLIIAASQRIGRHLAVVGGYRWSTQAIAATSGEAFAFHLNARGPLLGLRLE